MSEVNVQKSAGCNEIKINVKPVPVNPVVLENSYRGIDYNVLKHKPQIEGNELIGNKTAKELLGFDKTDMDATVSVAKCAEKVANAANEKAQNAVDIANAAKETADGIDAKATKALTNSNTAVNTANSAKQTAEGIDDKATQALTNSTDAKNIADSYQGQITTLRNDVDDLGDQVSQIEAKIPETATADNQLADKAFVTEKTDELAADIAALDADKADKATTLAGYGITDAYTKTETDNAIKAIQLIKWVETLPTTGESKYLYAVPQDEKTLDGENIVLLFVWNDTDGWATVGVQTTAVDLSEYAKQADLAAETSARKEADQALDTAVSSKYGPDNLTAGAGVEIKEYTAPTLIDAHTLAVFKFEDKAVPAENSVAEGAVFANRGGSADGTTAAGAKFGARAFRCAASNVSGWLQNSDSIPNADYTVDFWVKWGNSGRAGVCTGVSSDQPTGRGVIFYKNKLALPQAAGTGYINNDSVFDTAYDGAVWHHVAYEQKGHAYRVYIDGVQVAKGEYTSFGSESELYIWGWGGVLIDEVRVSDIARYDGDFTPNTEPYAYAEHKQYEITATARGAGLPLLSVHWSDHLLNRMDMLRADTFSWQDGAVYTSAYNELLTEYNNAASADETDGSISFKRTPKGYKICAADQEANVLAAYNNTGVAWYYILDVPNQRFKLPRKKFGFTGLRTGAGNYVAPGLPNITGTLETIPVSTTIDGKGAFRRSTTPNTVGASAGSASWSNVTFDASLSNPTYGNSTTVQPPATEMYLYFFVGNFTQSAVEQTAGLNAEAINGKADVDGMNAPALMKVPQFWQGADFAKMRAAIMDLDWANAIRTWSSTADSYRTEVMPADGLLAGVLSYNGQIEINGNKYSTGTTDAHWGASYVPFFVKKGDVVKARFNSSYTVLVPFKNQGNADYNPLGFFQYQGSFANVDSLPAPKINGWALVGNNQLYYVGTDDTGALVWLAGNTITDLGVTGADYVVASYSDASGNWWRKYKSGWLEQGGVYSGTFNTTSVHNLLLPFANTNYSILGEALDANDYTVSWCARKTSFTTASFTGEGFRGTTGNSTYNTLRWEAKGQGAE